MERRERCGGGQGAHRAWTLPAAGFLLLVAVACVVVYLPSRNGPFVFDDVRNIVANPRVRMTQLDPASLWRAMVPHDNLNLRPLSFLTFALNHYVGGYAPLGYHLANLAVLLASIPVAYLLALQLGSAWLCPGSARAVALGTTALWALHPLLTNGVSYVIQRMTALYTLFSLAALFFFLRGRLLGRPWPYALAGVSLLCALASKETALYTPFLAVLALWLLPREAGGMGPRAGWALAGLVAVSQAATAAAAQYALRLRWVPAAELGPTERFLTEGRVVLRYLELFFLPLPSQLTLDYAFPPSLSALSPPATLPAMALHAALVAFAVWVSRRRPLLAFGILGFYLLQLPEGTFMPLDVIFEHRAYFPAYFLALALMDLLLWGLGRLGARRAERWALAAAAALGVLWGGFGYQRNQVWADPVTLWEDTVTKAPGNVRALSNLGGAHLRRGNPRQAVEPLQEAVRLDPSYYEAFSNLGVAHLRLGDPRQAVGHLQEAVRLKPDYPEALVSLGAAHSDLGNLEKAVGYLREGIRLSPEFPEAHYDLGVAYLRLGDPQEAVVHLEEAIRLSPQLPEAHGALGAAYLKLGNALLAFEHLQTAVRLKPGYTAALYNLGLASGRLGRLEQAAEYYRGAIGAKPDHAAAHLELGITLLKLGREAEARAIWLALEKIDPERALALRRQMPGGGG